MRPLVTANPLDFPIFESQRGWAAVLGAGGFADNRFNLPGKGLAMKFAQETCRWSWFASGMLTFVLGTPGILQGDEGAFGTAASAPATHSPQID